MKLWLAVVFLVASSASAQLNDAFAKGETLDFELTWLHLAGGSMRMTIGPLSGDPTRLRMTSIAKSNSSFAFIFKVRDALLSIVNRGDFSTLRYEKHLNERGRKKDDVTIINERRKIAVRRRPNHDTEEIRVPKPVFDPLSLVYRLRLLDLQPGSVQRFTVFADGKVYTLEARVTDGQTVETTAGKFSTVAVEPKMLRGGLFRDEDSTLTIWFTDDVRHIPVRIRSELKVGSITATLQTITSGALHPEPGRSR